MLPGFSSPAASFDQPFEMLSACHVRVERSLSLLARLASHLRDHGSDDNARRAAADVLRYFDVAAPHHHEDEERHLFPPLLRAGSPELREAVESLLRDHQTMSALWARLRGALEQVAEGTQQALSPQDEEAIAAFLGLYAGHLDIEDRVVYPAARAMFSEEALQAMGVEMAGRRGAQTPPPGLAGRGRDAAGQGAASHSAA
jgi:hemerythrin-like domain-containing protein